MRKIVFRNVVAIIALFVVVFLVTSYAGWIQEQIGVKGASTTRAQNIAGKIGSDVGSQVDVAKQQAMHVSLPEVVTYFSRFQRIPKDISDIKNFTQEQVNNVLQSGSKKK